MINWHSFFFLLFALVACVFALAVVFTSNIVRMAFYLVLSLGATAGLFFLAGADFVGAMQLMIYVGGTLVLLVFGVMLTAQGPFISMKTRGGEWMLPACRRRTAAGGAVARRLSTSPNGRADRRSAGAATARRRNGAGVEAPVTATRLGLGLLGARVDRAGRRRAETLPAAHVGLFAAVRNRVGPFAGGADRRGLSGPAEEARSAAGCDSVRRLGQTMNPVDRTDRRVALSGGRRGDVRHRRRLHGHQAQRAGRADGDRTGAERRQHQFRGLRQRVSCGPSRAGRSGWTAS